MNAGLANLHALKSHLLPTTLAGETKFDTIIVDIGQGVAAAFENFCNRKFGRVVGAQEIFPADRANFLLSRFPVESVTLAELKQTDADGWIAQSATWVNTVDLVSGIIMLPDNADAGPFYAQVRFTFTGGYFFETAEPDDPAYPTVMPATATVLPSDLRTAWLLQCRQVWDQIDLLGAGIVDAPDADSALADLNWVPSVETTLKNYARMEMM